MPTYSYIALNLRNDPISGKMDQPERMNVIDALTKQGLRPISIRQMKVKTEATTALPAIFDKKVKNDHLVMFTRQLSAMVGAGVPILRALSALADNMDKKLPLREILYSIIRSVEAGSTLGDALAKFPSVFSDVYVNMVRAGESAGILDDILKRLAMQLEKSATMRKKIRSAMAYPLVLLAITTLAFFGLMIFIVPQIGKILTDLGGPDAQMPLITQAMLSISGFIVSYWYVILIVAIVLVVAVARYIKTPKGKRNFHILLLKLPIVSKITKKVAIARFTRTFSALIEAGVAVLQAIEVTSRAVGNVIYEESLLMAGEAVKNGRALSSVIKADQLYPPIVSQMLLVGEETGQTDKVLVKVADFYEEEVDITVGGIGTIIEPIMIVIMGGMVGLIAASVMLPIASLAQNIQ